MPYRSISANVVSMGSAPSAFSSGTSLNMYSAGNVNSPLVWSSRIPRIRYS